MNPIDLWHKFFPKPVEVEGVPKEKKPISLPVLISAIVHGVLVIALGGIVIFQSLERAPATFVTPPETKVQRIEPRKLEYKVRMQEAQKRSGRPPVSPRLTAASGVANIALPDIKINIPPVKIKTITATKNFGTGGAGSGFGGGDGSGGLGLGMSKVNFFGISDTTERICVLVDLSGSMVDDSKGGVAGYTQLKREIANVINNLSEGSFFNVIFFAREIVAFQPKLVLANKQMKQEAIDFMKSYYADAKNPNNSGLTTGNYKPKDPLPVKYGRTRMDMAFGACFDFGADTIFMISDGNHQMFKLLTQEEEDEIKRKYDHDWPAEKLEAKLKQVQKDVDDENEKRKKRGLPPIAAEQVGGWGDEYLRPLYNDQDLIDYMNKLYKEFYEPAKRRKPKVYTIGYVTTPPEETFLKAVAREFNGRFKQIKPLVKAIETKEKK